MKRNNFKKFFSRFFFGYLPFGLLISILALVDVSPIMFDEEPLSGIKGFLMGLLMIPFFTITLTVVVWLLYTFGDCIMKLLFKMK